MPNELEAIFRRGGEWEAGVELVVALALQASSGLRAVRQKQVNVRVQQQADGVHM